MSLRSLLPLGRAFRSSAERAGRFQPAQPGLLPDFSRGGREPGGEGGVSLHGTRGGGCADGEGVGGASPRGADGAAVGSAAGLGSGRPGAVGRSVGGGGRVRSPRGGRVGWRLPGWLEQLILVVMRSGNRRRSARPVQGEFALRSVTVAKNDLMTSDVEVVVRKSERPKPLSASCRARLLALWWSPVARRLGRWGGRTGAS